MLQGGGILPYSVFSSIVGKMSGHSKWSQIKRQKGAADQKRGVVFSKMARLITVAARHGADPESNFQLRIIIDKARAANMPKDNIDRALARAVGGSEGNQIEEALFEAYGPSGSAFMIEAATDNHNRTIGEVRAALNKLGGKLADPGSVSYLFARRGLLVLPLQEKNQEELELIAIEVGAKDIDATDEGVLVISELNELEAVRKKLLDRGVAVSEASLEWEPISPTLIADNEVAGKVARLTEALEELDDVMRVTSNCQATEE